MSAADKSHRILEESLKRQARVAKKGKLVSRARTVVLYTVNIPVEKSRWGMGFDGVRTRPW